MIVRGHEIFSPILRVGELISAAVVMGILAGYEHYIDRANASNNGRIVYSLVIACLTLLFSIILLIPFHASFFFFGLDFIFFVCWMVAFGLMANARAPSVLFSPGFMVFFVLKNDANSPTLKLTASDGCNSTWIWHDWGYYWGGWYRTVELDDATPVLVGTSYCPRWRANLAFAFIGGILWLLSAVLGLYVVIEYRKDRGDSEGRTTRHLRKMSHSEREPVVQPETAQTNV